ncbi:MAG: radical SAM protein [Angelakisella sp.]|nr:radical SAM protein [Angelakisella sp.]
MSGKSPHATIPVFIPHKGCPHQCSFCDQRTISGQRESPTPEAVTEFCRRALAELPARFQTAEIAFFGGSFTAIPQGEMTALLEAVKPLQRESRFGGIRISTRPDAIDRKILQTLKDYGVRAIELGAQSLYNKVLEANGRGHRAEDVRQAAELIRRQGFSLGLQMMTGLYGSTPDLDWETGLGFASLEPETVRIYPTVVFPGTGLARLMASGEYQPPGLEETVELCARLLELFESRGIRVIRLGLHAEEDVAQRALGGCFHPALGELCRSRLFLERVCRRLEENGEQGTPVILVPPGLLSQAMGQKRKNLLELRRRWLGIAIRPDAGLKEDFLILYHQEETKENPGGAVCG